MDFPDYFAWLGGCPETNLFDSLSRNLMARHRLEKSTHPICQRLKNYIKIDGSREFFVCPHCPELTPIRIDNLEDWHDAGGDKEQYMLSFSKISNIKKHLSTSKHRFRDLSQFTPKTKLSMTETFQLNEPHLLMKTNEDGTISVKCHACRWLKKHIPKSQLYLHCKSEKHIIQIKEREIGENYNAEINWHEKNPIVFNEEEEIEDNPFIDFHDGNYTCSLCHFNKRIEVEDLDEEQLEDLRFFKRQVYNRRSGQLTDTFEKVPRNPMKLKELKKHLKSDEHNQKLIDLL
jgi:hypothetical protein